MNTRLFWIITLMLRFSMLPVKAIAYKLHYFHTYQTIQTLDLNPAECFERYWTKMFGLHKSSDEIPWKISTNSSNRVLETWKINAKQHWSWPSSTWKPNKFFSFVIYQHERVFLLCFSCINCFKIPTIILLWNTFLF